ncbi:MAG: hypothetical protein ACTSQF_11285 [Candidatus Heimdallarchaeaceae archaeon]
MQRYGRTLFILIVLFSSVLCVNRTFSKASDFPVEIIENEEIQQSNNSAIENSDYIQAYESFGNQEEFWTANLNTNEWFLVRATLLSVGEYCYIYMDNQTIASMGQSQAIDRCEILSSEFDHTVYPKNLELMGHPNGTLGDIDGDLHITVFLVEGVGSYYLQHNELVGYSYSNQREMVFVSSQMPLLNTIAIMCHETNHLFLFNNDLNEAVFFTEGLAEFSMYYAGYMSNYSFMQGGMTINTTSSAQYFSQHPSVSLFFFDANYYAFASYGYGYMFLFYIAEKYGIDIIKDLVLIDVLDGPEAYESVLSNHGFEISFNSLFLDFITACTIDELGIYDDLFGFVNADFHITNTRLISSLPSTKADIEHRYYGVEIEKITSVPDKFTLEIETPAYPRSLGVVIIIEDDNGWNVTQSIVTGNGSTVRIHCNGDNIQNAYLVTSLMKEGTPNAVRLWSSSPVNELTIVIKEGFHYSLTDANWSFLASFLPFFVIFAYYVKRKREKEVV